MARIGYLYLHNGHVGRKADHPAGMGRARQGGQIPATFGFHYANLWWSLPEKGAYMARGRHSQLILVLPKLDIVAAMTGVMRDDEYYPLVRLINDIAQSVRSDQPLPADPTAKALLTGAIRQAATEKPSAVAPAPDLAKEISGKRFLIADNDLHVKSFTLNFFDLDLSWEITTDTGKDHSVQRFSGLMGLDGVFRRVRRRFTASMPPKGAGPTPTRSKSNAGSWGTAKPRPGRYLRGQPRSTSDLKTLTAPRWICTARRVATEAAIAALRASQHALRCPVGIRIAAANRVRTCNQSRCRQP